MPSVASAAAQIHGAAAPVVFLDTCVLLDIVRAPLRNAPRNVAGATELLVGVRRNPPTVHLVIACPTPREWIDHIGEAVQDCETAVNGIDAVAACCDFVGLPSLGPVPAGVSMLPERLRLLSKELLDASLLLDKDGDALSRALDRIIAAQKPARKGGQGAKDATILEHAVSLVDALLGLGFAAPRLFVNSNTGDFATAKTSAVHPDIAPAFAAPRDIRYYVNLAAAVAELKAGGWIP